jgi:hypothetical protein
MAAERDSHRAKIMIINLHCAPGGILPTQNRAISAFLKEAGQTRFEMRYLWEGNWYPAPADDVARTLAGYHSDLHRCLARMLNGEEVASRLALFRVAQD